MNSVRCLYASQRVGAGAQKRKATVFVKNLNSNPW